METERIKEQSGFITYPELIRTQDALRKELSDKIDGNNRRLDDVDDKVDNLRDMVLPLLETSKQTAENTRKMAESMEKFTESQRATNGRIYEKLNGHDVTLEGLRHTTSAQADKKKANVGVIIAVITTAGGIIVGLFQLAPFFFNN